MEQLIEVVPYYNVRHSINPGITGWAQVRYGYGSSAVAFPIAVIFSMSAMGI